MAFFKGCFMEAFFVALYPLVGLCHVLAYFPQIKALASSDADVTCIPAVTWVIWLGANLLTLGYNIFHVQDIMLTVTTVLNSILMLTVLALILHNQRKKKQLPLPQAAE